MKAIIKMFMSFVLAGLMIGASSCATNMVYEQNVRRVATKKALVAGNEKAVRSLQMGADAEEAGIPVSSGEAIAERPALLGGALLLDGGLLWGGYKGIKAIDDNSSSDEPTTYGDSAIVIKGDGNTVNVDKPTTNNNAAP